LKQTCRPPAGTGRAIGSAGSAIGERASSNSISRSVAPEARSRSPHTSASTATLPATIIT
jgi:hypothetical protein